VIVKFTETGVAALKLVLPGCVAWMVQVPTVTSVTVVFDTVQIDVVVEANPTARPELAVAVSPNVPAENANAVTEGANVIVCEA
jgi:hypothetical protein